MVDLHPDADRLAAFRLGKLGEDELAEVERHVADCASCCQTLKSLADDSFVSLLRQSAGKGPAARTEARTVDEGGTVTDLEAEVPAELRDHPRYQMLEKLGQGGMGVVYRARHRLMDRVVALKILNPRLLDRPASVERFRQEVKGAARLIHPHIVTAYDADQAGASHFLVMEYVPGTSLARLVEEQGPLPVHQACDYVRQAALGLQHAHECGMVHRDIKPQNLVVLAQGAGEGLVKILDFGLARFVSETTSEGTAGAEAPDPAGRLTQASTVMGTPEYIAPEQARAAHAADIRADIYSLGCTLYYLLAGHAPFPHGSAVEKVKAHLEQTPRPLGEVRPDVPAELAQVLGRMLAKDPAARYQTPAEVAEALVPWARPPLAGTRPRRRPRLLVRLGLAILAAAVVAVVLCLSLGQNPEVASPGNDPHGSTSTNGRPAVRPEPRPTSEGGWVARTPGLPVQALAVSPDGKFVAAGGGLWRKGDRWQPGSDFDVRLLDAATGKAIRRLKGPRAPVRTVAFSPDGKRLAAAVRGGPAYLWDVAGGGLLHTFGGPKDEVYWVAFAPDGKALLTTPGRVTLPTRLWDADTGKELKRLGTVNPGPFQEAAVAFLPGGKHIVLAGRAEAVVVDTESDTVVTTLNEPGGPAAGLSLSRDGNRLLATTSKNVWMWDFINPAHMLWVNSVERAPLVPRPVALLPDGKRYLMAGTDGVTVGLFGADRGSMQKVFKCHTGPVTALAATPDGACAVSGGLDQTVCLWRLPATDGRVAATDGPAVRPQPQSKVLRPWVARTPGLPVQALAVSPDGKLVAAGGGLWRKGDRLEAGSDFDVRLLDAATGKELRRLKGPTVPVRALAFTPDGKRLVADATGQAAYVWDVGSGGLLHVLGKERPYVWGMALAPDGRTLLTTSLAGKLFLWDVESGKQIRGLHVDPRRNLRAAAAVFLPGGKRAVVEASDKQAAAVGRPQFLVLDLKTDQVLRTLDYPADAVPGPVASLSLSRDGTRLLVSHGASAGHGAGVWLWGLPDGHVLWGNSPLRAPVVPTQIALLPDGERYLMSASDGVTVVLSGTSTGSMQEMFKGHTDLVMALALAPDGAYAVSGGLDQAVRLWPLPAPDGFSAGRPPGPAREKTDAEKLQGTWALTFVEVDGKRQPAGADKKFEIRFDAKGFELLVPGGKPGQLRGKFRIDPVKKQIWLEPDGEKHPSLPWSYLWQGDRLTLDVEAKLFMGGGPAPPVSQRLRMQFQRSAPVPDRSGEKSANGHPN
jgi:uncharacterized protein (TIGR03067 family)